MMRTLINCLNDAHIKVRTTIEENICDVIKTEWVHAPKGQRYERDVLGRDWCVARMNRASLSSEQSEQARAKKRDYMMEWRTIR